MTRSSSVWDSTGRPRAVRDAPILEPIGPRSSATAATGPRQRKSRLIITPPTLKTSVDAATFDARCHLCRERPQAAFAAGGVIGCAEHGPVGQWDQRGSAPLCVEPRARVDAASPA